MILRRIVLNPFGGVAYQEVEFAEGLNVILGPNEAGKSTLVNALKMVLFVPTQYGKRLFDQEIARFLPLAGGDTILVELAFSVEPKLETYSLSKSWGGRCEARLVLPTGGLLAEPLALQRKLRELLVLGEGTYNSVIFAYQSGLGATLERLKSNPEARHDLATLLRRATYETDGVSIDILAQRLEEKRHNYYSRWNADLKCPEDNRGIDNPWIRGKGIILEAHYDQEHIRRSLEEVREHERKLDALNARIRAIMEEVDAIRKYVATHRESVEDAKKRRGLEAQLALITKEERELKELAQKWPKLEEEIRGCEQNLKTLQKKQAKVTAELDMAKTFEEHRQKLDKFARAKKKKEVLDQARAALAMLIAVTTDDFRCLEELHGRMRELKASLAAGTLSVHFLPGRPMELQIAKGLERVESCALSANQALELSADGYCELQHPDWTLTVKSGDLDFATLKNEYGTSQMEYHSLLSRLGMPDFEAAKGAHKAHKEQIRMVDGLDEELKAILDGESYEDLEAVVLKVPKAPPRASADVGVELGEVNSAVNHNQKEIEGKRIELNELVNTYKSTDHLLELLVGKGHARRDFEEKLAELKPLPEGITDLDGFITEFAIKEADLEEKEGNLDDMRIQRAGIEAKAPIETGEELEPQLREAQSRFEQTLREGEAVGEILRVFRAVKSDMDGDTLHPWLEELQKLVVPITAGRYQTIALEEQDLGKAVRYDGLQIPAELLSGGTRPSLGLACRLSMARHFLEGLMGFMVLDDPMVDMDAARQQVAALVIQEFARDKQIIVLTCHEAHAQLLGGNRIELG